MSAVKMSLLFVNIGKRNPAPRKIARAAAQHRMNIARFTAQITLTTLKQGDRPSISNLQIEFQNF